jgi:hypothetical protein
MLTDCRERHTAKDFVRFLRVIDRNVPAALGVHLVLDNLSAHKAPEVQAWLLIPSGADSTCTSPLPAPAG